MRTTVVSTYSLPNTFEEVSIIFMLTALFVYIKLQQFVQYLGDLVIQLHT
jgi:hypothetical protein